MRPAYWLGRGARLGLAALGIVAALSLLRGRASAAVTIQEPLNGGWQNGQVVLHWVTASELDNLGFNIWRAVPPEGDFIIVNPAMILSNCPGQPACDDPNYTYTDTSATPGQPYLYRLESISLSGAPEFHDPLVCAAPTGMSCDPPTSTATATRTATLTRAAPLDPTATPTGTASQAPSSDGGGQANPTALNPPTATQSPIPSSPANSAQPTATQRAAASATPVPPRTRTQPAPANPTAARATANPGSPSATALPSATESPANAGAATAVEVAALPTRFTFATATLLPSPTVAVADSGGAQPQGGQTAQPASGSAQQPAGLPFGAPLGVLLNFACLGLIALSAAGYWLWQHGRR